MQISLKRTAIVLLGVMLALVVFSAINSSQQAQALSTTQWEKVRGYVSSYFSGPQYDAAKNGEAGFRINKTALVARLDSNNDISPKAAVAPGSPGTAVTGVAGENDDMANRPVLIDNLMTQTGMVPGTEFRCNWNVNESCFSDTSITAIRQIVDAHADAGFSTDIVDHCVSAQTAGPSTGGFGIIAQVPGALSSNTSLIPNVYTLDYARNGWRNAVSTALVSSNTVAAPEVSAGGFAAPATVANCDLSATDYELVRCQANWAIASTGGNVGNGQTVIATISGAGVSVDTRAGAVNTMSSAGTNLSLPINTLFATSGLDDIDPTKSVVMVNRTQMGSIAAIGMKMLGYNMIAGGSISTGIPRWNSGEGEQQIAEGDNLPLQTVSIYAAPGKVDIVAPTVTSVGSSGITTSSANIDRVAAEPATMKVEYGTTSGGPYTSTVNNTVLNASKTVGLSSLSASTTYYYRVTSYDGQANGTVSAEASFTTSAPACSPARPSLSLSAPAPFWASYADYTARQLSVNWTISNTGSNGATSVAITGSTNTNGVTVTTALPASAGSIGAGSSAVVMLKYHVPLTTGSWRTSNTASANDDCGGTGYTYP